MSLGATCIPELACPVGVNVSVSGDDLEHLKLAIQDRDDAYRADCGSCAVADCARPEDLQARCDHDFCTVVPVH